jgi:hypothetical protein
VDVVGKFLREEKSARCNARLDARELFARAAQVCFRRHDPERRPVTTPSKVKVNWIRRFPRAATPPEVDFLPMGSPVLVDGYRHSVEANATLTETEC